MADADPIASFSQSTSGLSSQELLGMLAQTNLGEAAQAAAAEATGYQTPAADASDI